MPKNARKRRSLSPGTITAIVGLVGLLAFNVWAFSRPALHQPAEVMEWRKGPLVKDYSPYASANSARIFWPVAAGMVDVYALAMVAWARWGRRRLGRRRPAVELAVSVGAMVLALGAGELAARAVIHQYWYLQYHPDPELYWYNRPDLRDHVDATDKAPRTTNGHGFRMDREVSRRKNPDEVRVFVVGDSSTFGLGVADDQTFSAVLERSLAEMTGRPITVLNSGCPGHTSYQGMILLQRHGIPLGSDIVVWAYNNDSCLDTMAEEDRVSQNRAVVSLQKVLYRLDTYLLFRRVVVDLAYGMRTEEFAARYPQDPSQWVRRIPFDDYRDYLDEFVAVTDEADARMVFVRMPLNRPACEQNPIYYTSFDDEYRDYLSAWCLQSQQVCVDFEHPWDHPYVPGKYLPGHLFHPSATGHREIGQTLASVIVNRGLLP